MQAEPIALENEASFYIGAQDSLAKGEVNQRLEDELDRLMELEHEQDAQDNWRQDTEIESVMFPEDPGPRKNLKTDVYPSEFTEFAIRIPTKGDLAPFSFEGREYLRGIYDSSARRTLLKFGRQSEKSTLLGNKALAYCGIVPNFRVLYVSATATQSTVFSVDRLREPIEISPELSYLLDSRLSQNVLFKQFKNRSQIRIRYAFLHADRCLHGDSRVQMADGTLRTIRELAGAGGDHQVIASTEEGVPVKATATDAHLSGRKRVVRVVTDYPVDLLCSFDHPVLTGRGWVKAEELREDDFVAAPHTHKVLDEESIGEDWAWLLGAMISEGECSKKKSVRFTNSDEAYLEEFIRRAERVGVSVGEKVEDSREGYKTCWSVGLYSDSRGPGVNGPKLDLWELGEFGKKAGEKRIPQAVWRAAAVEKAAFLWALFCGDGWCCPDNGGARAGYSSSSRLLVEDLAHMLWSFGIRSSIREKAPSTKNANPSWTLSLSKHPTEKLIDLIGPFRDCPVERTRPQDNTDRIPITYQQLREHLREKHGLSTHSAWMKHRIQLRPGNVKDSVGRRVLCSIAGKLEDQELRAAADDQKSWVRVKRVEESGVDNVYDLTVEGPGCFVADGLVVHNTRGIPADQILIDEIQDIVFKNVPVIEQCASHSDWKLFCYSGTPKSLDNTIEIYWAEHSTQNEWVVPCERHGTPKNPSSWYWNILGSRNIGKYGPVCAKCKQPIDPGHPNAQWASMQPVSEENMDRVAFEGFRVSQLMVPWVVGDTSAWYESIIFPYENYDKAQFNNEVLGLSYDSGQRPLTKHQVKACCQDGIRMYSEGLLQDYARRCHGGVAAGLDHGCHDDKTKILTDSGFKYFSELTDDDLVAQFEQDTRVMSFVQPIERTVRDWDGDLYHFNGKATDMMLTPDHRMLVRPLPMDKWKVEPTKQVVARRGALELRGFVDWVGEEREFFTLPGLPKSPGYGGAEPLTIPMDLWLEFLGYLVSEGGLCFSWNKNRTKRLPSCIKITQRGSGGRMGNVERIRSCLEKLGIRYTEFPDKSKPGDFRWTIYGKQLWSWVKEHVGSSPENKRVPREFLNLSKRQLWILVEALVFGDGSVDPRPNCDSGAYYSTSRGLCEDVQELCIRLGLRATVRPHKPADEVRKARYRVLWAGRRDRHLNVPALKQVKRVHYEGKVYCCKVPSGFIVTERNGCLAFQGNTGERESYSVLTLGGYMGGEFQIFFAHRFIGEDLDPRVQLLKIAKILQEVNFFILGSDYGGGFDRNDWLMRNFGPHKVMKYQYASGPKKKIKWEPELGRFILHRTEIMSDMFNAIRNRKIWLPNYEDFRTPYASDMLNIFSEYNQQIHMTQYKVSPGKSDDTFHSALYCFLASMFIRPRPDILIPVRPNDIDFTPDMTN